MPPSSTSSILSDFYLSDLRAQIASTSAHFLGTSFSSHTALRPSILPTNAYWTSREKSAFFHALSVHSRLRPDLIAVEVGTKGLEEVLVYLEALEDASSGVAREKMDWRAVAGAVEASEEWIEEEERLAQAVARAEADWAHAEAQKRMPPNGHDNDNILESQFSALHNLDTYLLRALDRILREEEEDGDSETEGEDAPNNESLPPFVSEQVIVPELPELPSIPIDPVLLSPRKNPGTHSRIHQPTLFQPTWTTLPPLPSSSQPDFTQPFSLGHSQDQQQEELVSIPPSTHSLPDISFAFASSSRLSSPIPPGTPSPNQLALASLSSPSDPAPSVPAAAADGSDVEDVVDPATLSPRSRRRHQKRLHMRRKRAALRGKDVDEVSAHVGRLKPGRKPKVERTPNENKEHPFASKHGEEEGEEDGAGTATSSTRKRKRRASNEDGHDDDDGDRTSDSDGWLTSEEDRDKTRPSKRSRAQKASGQTRDLKALRTLANAGINASFLRERGMGLFRCGALGRMLRAHASSLGSKTVPALSGAYIQALAALIRAYITRLVHATIVQASTHKGVKMHTKVWKMHVGGRAGQGQGDGKVEVDAEDVERAVECVPGGIVVDEGEEDEEEGGDEDESDEEEAEVESEDTEESDEESDDSSSNSEDEIPFSTSSGPALPPLSTIRMIHAPFVRVPLSPTPLLFSDSQASEGGGGDGEDEDEDGEDGRGDIAEAWRLDEEEFNEAEEKEIEEEQEIEERDAVMFEVAEKGMWDTLEKERESRVGQNEVGNERETKKRKMKNASGKVKEGKAAKKRTAARGKEMQEDALEDEAMETEDAHGRIRSAAFIEDSGEE